MWEDISEERNCRTFVSLQIGVSLTLLDGSIRVIFYFMMNKWFSRGNIQPIFIMINLFEQFKQLQAGTYLHAEESFSEFLLLRPRNYTIIESENHKTCIKKHTSLQWWIRRVIQILSIPWITRISAVSSSIKRYVYENSVLKQQNGKFYNF